MEHMNMTRISYDILVRHEKDIIHYLTKHSDTFSLVAVIQKPYSQHPPVFPCSRELEPFAVEYLRDRSDWPVNFLSRCKHQVLAVYRCCRDSRTILADIPNPFSPEKSGLPEDICFYRDGKIWFATVSHEQIAYVCDLTNEDIAFFHSLDLL